MSDEEIVDGQIKPKYYTPGYQFVPEPIVTGMEFNDDNLQMMRGDRIMEIPEPVDRWIVTNSSASCPCGFRVVSPDTETVRETFDSHTCHYLEPLTPGVTWHESFGRLITNLAGWSVIGLFFYWLFNLWT